MTDTSPQMNAILDNDPDAIALVDADGRFLYASAAAARVLGCETEEMMGRSNFELLHAEDRDRSLRNFKRILADPQSESRTLARFRQNHGPYRWVETTSSNLLNVPDVAAIIMVYREVSDLVNEEEALRRTAEELRLQIAELQDFAHTVAHDLREPLRSISGCTELLLRNAQLDEEDQENARFIVDGVHRMSALLDRLLASATRAFNVSLGPVNLDDAAAHAVDNLRAAVTTSGALITIHPLPVVRGIETDLIRVFQNLIGNAMKYRSAAPPEIDITAEESGSDVIIRVRDNGIGIPEEQHRGVFGLFRRLHAESVPGTGIGLTVCKSIIEGMGGAIWVVSEPGSGSTFCFTVSAAHGESGNQAASSEGH